LEGLLPEVSAEGTVDQMSVFLHISFSNLPSHDE
jgi:hypothetical protein